LRYPAAACPQTDIDTVVVLDHALVDLADRRFMKHLDAAIQLHLLASLTAQAETWIDEQTQRARATGATWAEIGRLLGITAAAARQRYGPRRIS
jgi:predicted phage gp36 major capsid-like protein